MESLDGARRLLARSRRAVAFTGTGVSTASGVPDFRSPGGIWSRYRPVTIQEFRGSAEARKRYWRYKKETYADFARARPNAAHAALARLETEARLLGVITQTIDGLHQDAGSRRAGRADDHHQPRTHPSRRAGGGGTPRGGRAPAPRPRRPLAGGRTPLK